MDTFEDRLNALLYCDMALNLGGVREYNVILVNQVFCYLNPCSLGSGAP